MNEKRGGPEPERKECSVCGQAGQRMVDGVSGDHELCKRVVDLDERVLTLEAPCVGGCWREARSMGELVDRVEKLEAGGMPGMSGQSVERLEDIFQEWSEKHVKVDIEKAMEILSRMGYGRKGNGQGGPKE